MAEIDSNKNAVAEISLKRIKVKHAKKIHEIMSQNAEAQSFVKPLKYWIDFAKYSEKNPDDLSWIALNSKKQEVGVIFYGKKLHTSYLLDQYTPLKSLVLSIYVNPKFIRNSYGKQMFLESLKLIPLNFEVIYASTYSTNIPAQKFFEKLEFKKVGEGKSILDKKNLEEIVIYELKIPKKE